MENSLTESEILSLDKKNIRSKNNIFLKKNIDNYSPYKFQIKKSEILTDQSLLYAFFLLIKNSTHFNYSFATMTMILARDRKYFYLFLYDFISSMHPDLFSKIFNKNFFYINFTVDALYMTSCIKKSKKLYRYSSRSFNSFLVNSNKKVILDQDFILRVPYNYMIFLGSYLEYFRQFKYHEYLSINLVKRPFIKDSLLCNTEDFNPIERYYKNFINNKILYYNYIYDDFGTIMPTNFFNKNKKIDYRMTPSYKIISKKNNLYFLDFSALQLLNI